jgi:hypothetical protein
MIKDNMRICDVCGETIPKGEKYRVNTLPKETALLFKEMATSDMESAPTWSVDSNGNVRLDTCTNCVLHMGEVGEIRN